MSKSSEENYRLLFEHNRAHVSFQATSLNGCRDGTGTLISDHGIRVALIVHDAIVDSSELSDTKKNLLFLAALYHDVLEDTPVTVEELINRAGSTVTALVQELTISFEGVSIQDAVKSLYIISDEATLIKLADIIDNVEKSIFFPRPGTPGFYNDFFLPLLAEYEKILKSRQGDSSFEKEFDSLFHRLKQSLFELRTRLAFFEGHLQNS